MANHQNRSRSSTERFIAYSLASMNALTEGSSIDDAVRRSNDITRGDQDFIVIASVTSRDALHRFDRLPLDARIVWRGANELAQKFRNR